MSSRFLKYFSVILSCYLLLPSMAWAECVDPDGDGYGLNNNRACRTRPTRRRVPDAQNLTVSNVTVSDVTGSSVRITANFSEPASGKILFGKTHQFDKASLSIHKSRYFAKTLSGLTPNLNYSFKIEARSGKSFASTSVLTFKTVGAIVTTSTTKPQQQVKLQGAPSHIAEQRDARISFTFSHPAQAQLEYGKSQSETQLGEKEISFDYESHEQKLYDLEPGTLYHYRVIFLGRDTGSDNLLSDWYTFTTKGEKDEVSSYWESQGYELQWSDTPTVNDYGKTGVQFFQEEDHFNNGNELVLGGYQETDYGSQESSQVSFVELNGIPVMKVFVPPNDRMAMSVVGHQLPNNTDNDAVFSYHRFIPCGYGQVSKENRVGGLYIGSGLYWGSAKGSTNAPGGSRNYDDSWSVRSPLGVSGYSVAGQDILYIYPSRPTTTTDSGLVIGGKGPTVPCGVWQQIEVEVIQNVPASAPNGQINLYIDGVKTVQYTGQLRKREDVYPKGFGIFVQLRAPVDQILYQRDWRMYTRP